MTNLSFLKYAWHALLNILKRCGVIYIIVAIALFLLVDYRVVALKTLDFLGDSPVYLNQCANGENSFDSYKLRQAIRYYRNLSKIFPQSSTIHGSLGFCYYQLGKYRNSEKYYRKAIELEDDLLGFYYNLGLISFQNGESKKAISALEEALQTSPEKTMLYPHVTFPNPENKKDRNKEKSEQMQNSYANCYALLALSYNSLDRPSDMLNASLKGARLALKNKEFFYYYAGVAAYKLEEYKKSALYLRRCIELNPKYINAYRYLSLSFRGLNLNDLSGNILQQVERIQEPEEAEDITDLIISSGLYFYAPVRIITIDGKKHVLTM